MGSGFFVGGPVTLVEHFSIVEIEEVEFIVSGGSDD